MAPNFNFPTVLTELEAELAGLSAAKEVLAGLVESRAEVEERFRAIRNDVREKDSWLRINEERTRARTACANAELEVRMIEAVVRARIEGLEWILAHDEVQDCMDAVRDLIARASQAVTRKRKKAPVMRSLGLAPIADED